MVIMCVSENDAALVTDFMPGSCESRNPDGKVTYKRFTDTLYKKNKK